MKKIEFLESIRGISAMIVLLFHLKDVSNSPIIHNFLILNGEIFVDFFFVLSGFVIAYNYSTRINTVKDLLKFKLKRILRLYPLHILMLLIFSLLEVAKYFVNKKVGMSPSTEPFLINNINTFVHNLTLTNGFLPLNSFNIPSWSISVEFFAYFLFSLIILLIKSRKIRFFIFASISFFSLCYIMNGGGTLKSMENEDGFVRCCFSFFLGTIIFNSLNFIKFNSKYTNFLILIFLVFLVISLIIQNNFLGILLFSIILLISVSEQNNLFVKILSIKPLLYLGSISYGVYMIHFFVIWVEVQFTRFIFKINPDGITIVITTIFFTILLSYLSKNYLENKFSNLGSKIKFS